MDDRGGTGTKKYKFELFLNGAKIKTRAYSTAKTFSYIPTQPGSYKVKAYVKDLTGEKNKTSALITIIGGSTDTVYRACLIGQSNYDYQTDLHGTSDTGHMQNMLNNLSMGYIVNRYADRTASGIISAISSAFSGADTDDVSLFYYSGHGVVDGTSSYAGSLCGTDAVGSAGLVTPAQLRDALNSIPGTVIVLLDSCGSGSYVKSKDGTVQEMTLTKADASAFNAAIISAFKGFTVKLGDLKTEKFKVITASAYNASSWETSTNGVYYGYFTRYLCKGAGYDILSGRVGLNADSNGDSTVAQMEAHTYVNNNISSSTQVAQVYPANSTYPFFKR